MRTTRAALIAALVLLTAFLLGACTAPPADADEGAVATTQVVEPPTAAPTLTPTASPTPDLGYEPVFEPTDCLFAHRRDGSVECGYLVVPEDRSDPTGRTVRLHVAVFKSPNPDAAPDPVIQLMGGPGSSLLDKVSFYLRAGGSQILQNRDYIMFNQRGTAYTEPELRCDAYNLFLWQAAEDGLSGEAYDEQLAEVVRGCRDELTAQGINLSAYNSVENAADVNDLRRALGYDEVNLYGISYGSRLALTVMRYYPEHIRSVIIDAVYPPQVGLYSELPANAERALGALFEDCAADPVCNVAQTNLEASFYEAYDSLEQQQLPVPVYGPDRQYVVQVDGDRFANMMFSMLYSLESLPYVPGWIHDARTRDQLGLATPLTMSLGFDAMPGMYWSVQCRDEVSFETPEQTAELAAGVPPQLASAFTASSIARICEVWDVGQPDAVEDEPVESDIPALVFTGEYDPITPPEWARLAAETLPNSYLYEFEGIGHGVMRANPCALSMGLAFLDDPSQAPDSSCMADLTGLDFPPH